MNKIKELRIQQNLTQQQLADKSTINIRQIQKIEKGEIDINNVTLKNALSLAKALQCTVENLL